MGELLCDPSIHLSLRESRCDSRTKTEKLLKRLEEIWIERIALVGVETGCNGFRKISIQKMVLDLGGLFLEPIRSLSEEYL